MNDRQVRNNKLVFRSKCIKIFIASAGLLLFSCNKKEVFSPDKYIITESIQSGSSNFEINKKYVYSEKKQLASVWLKDGNTSLTLEYNKDKTIKKITENNATNYAVLSYENKLITQIQYYENNQLARECLFFRKEKKNTINKIEYYVYDGFSAGKKNVLADMLFPEVKSVHKSHKSGEKSLYSVQNITYEEDNIFRVSLSYVIDNQVSLYSITTYKYDDKKNPYYGLSYFFTDLTGYSKNNVKSTITSLENDPFKTLITVENSYSYEKKYPVYNSVVESRTYIVGYETVIEDGKTITKPIWNTTLQYWSYKYAYK